MSETKILLKKFCSGAMAVGIAVFVVIFIGTHFSVFYNLALALIGFGLVVLVHEFGHFIVAKLSGIKVEAFSMGFPPIAIGILRTADGFRIRILPKFFRKNKDDEEDEGRLCFTVGNKGKAGETEYRIGLIPFGGFVKMLGQEDVKEVEASDDPRSYANKSVGIRMGVISGGVVFNVIGALIIFIGVFLVGIERHPAVIGGVRAGTPAALAGIRAVSLDY